MDPLRDLGPLERYSNNGFFLKVLEVVSFITNNLLLTYIIILYTMFVITNNQLIIINK